MKVNKTKIIGKRRESFRYGFTMIEVMAMLVIISLLAAMVSSQAIGYVSKAKKNTTKASLRILHSAVYQFKMDTGRYPTEYEGLLALIEPPSGVVNYMPGGYLNTTNLPIDGWGTEFVYRLTPGSKSPFVIISYGADNTEGGEDDNADLYSTDAH